MNEYNHFLTKEQYAELNYVLEVVTKVTQISKRKIRSNSRKQEVIEAKLLYFYILSVHTPYISHNKRATFIDKDHSTSSHYVKSARNLLSINDAVLNNMVDKFYFLYNEAVLYNLVFKKIDLIKHLKTKIPLDLTPLLETYTI